MDIYYNPTNVFLNASYCAMPLHHLISRKCLLESEIIMIERLTTLTQVSVHRLFVMKQLMSQNMKESFALKPHIWGHFGTMLRLFGHSGITNADQTESAHVGIKDKFGRSSKKLFNFEELLLMDRTEKISSSINKHILHGNNSNIGENDEEINIDNSSHIQHDIETTWFLPKLGYTTILTTKGLPSENGTYIWNFDFNSSFEKVPLHPILELSKLQQLFEYNLNDPNKAQIEGWKQIGYKCCIGEAKITLLNAVRIVHSSEIEQEEKSYLLYAKKSYEIKAAPNIRANSVFINRFNCVEVSYNNLTNKYFIIFVIYCDLFLCFKYICIFI